MEDQITSRFRNIRIPLTQPGVWRNFSWKLDPYNSIFGSIIKLHHAFETFVLPYLEDLYIRLHICTMDTMIVLPYLEYLYIRLHIWTMDTMSILVGSRLLTYIYFHIVALSQYITLLLWLQTAINTTGHHHAGYLKIIPKNLIKWSISKLAMAQK